MRYNQKQEVVILGSTGDVGKTLVKQILDKDNEKRIITGLASSNAYLYNLEGLSHRNILDFSNKEIIGEPYENLKDVLYHVKASQQSPTAFIDVTTADETITPIHLQIVQDYSFQGMVTANKSPLIRKLKDFETLTSDNGRYQFQCSVMAGAGAIRAVDEAYELKENIESIKGIFSGTCAYLCSRMREGVSFSQALSEAIAEKYTETDYRKDLGGFDSGVKLLVLARRAGKKINLEDISIAPFLPAEAFVEGENLEDFGKKILQYDSYFAQLMEKANSQGKSLTYLAKMYAPSKYEVDLEMIEDSHTFSNLQGTRNGFEIITDGRYPLERPQEIIAPGAGLDVTAGNIRVGLNELYRNDNSFR